MLLALIIVLLIIVLAAQAWVNRGIFRVTMNQAAQMTLIESIQAELKMAQEPLRKCLAYGWYDGVGESDSPMVPGLLHHISKSANRNPNDYATQMLISEYRSMANAPASFCGSLIA